MEHLQKRDLPPSRRATESRHNREIMPAPDSPSWGDRRTFASVRRWKARASTALTRLQAAGSRGLPTWRRILLTDAVVLVQDAGVSVSVLSVRSRAEGGHVSPFLRRQRALKCPARRRCRYRCEQQGAQTYLRSSGREHKARLSPFDTHW